MTPKEKAIEIMSSFDFGGAWGELETGQKIDYALIVVDFVLSTMRRGEHCDPSFWQEVKKELESFMGS